MADENYILRSAAGDFLPENKFEDMYSYITQQWQDSYLDNVSMIDSSSEDQVTYSQLLDLINSVSASMTSSGVSRNDVISVCCSNCMEVLITAMAAWKLGACIAMIGSSLTPEEICRQLVQVDTTFVMMDSRSKSKASSVLERLNGKHVFSIGKNHDFLSLMSTRGSSSVQQREQEERHQQQQRQHTGDGSSKITSVHQNDTALILFSSGTTGLPKAAQLTHRNMILSMEVTSAQRTGAPMPTQILFLPLSHFYGLFAVLKAFVDCSTVVIMPKFELDEYLRLVSLHRVAVLFLVPAVAVMLTKNPDILEKYDLSRVFLFYSSAAPLSPETVKQLQTLLPNAISRVSQTYGMTETTGTITRHPLSTDTVQYPCPINSMGLVVPVLQLKVIDVATGRALPPNTTGEIVVRGETVMKGYYADPVATSQIIDKDGWLHTGDIGYYDEVGYLFIVDRAKELIKHNGMQVAPAELENVLLSHPAVQDAAVIGIPDELTGEIPMAFVVVKTTSDVTESQLINYVAGEVAPYKQLRGGVRFVQEIPRVHSGKILRRVLRDSVTKSSL